MAAILLAVALIGSCGNVHAEAYLPDSDQVVLEHLPPAILSLRKLRGDASLAAMSTPEAALMAARRFVETGQIYSDPRAYGYAEAALGRWWLDNDGATPPLLVMRARILQFQHRFPEALAQLQSALDADQFQPDAWLLFASIELVQGNVPGARAGCLKVLPMADPLVGATCVAATGALSGQSAAAESLLAKALAQPTATSVGERVWAWTTLAEIRAGRADDAGAATAFREALKLQPDEVYARAAFADLLLDDQRNIEARRVLGDAGQADALLLRAAIAASRNGDADATALRASLDARFAEARERGDNTHLREQARFALDVEHDADKALGLAKRNFDVQREPADARILLEAAHAAGDPGAAKPALDWIAQTGIDEKRLRELADAANGTGS